MKNVPAMCIDNFYSNPDEVRKFALKQTYTPSVEGLWPGVRTPALHLCDKVFFDSFCEKLLSVIFDLSQVQVNYTIASYFQIVNQLDPDPISPKNLGWIHYDENTIFAGVIFLTPEINVDTGTSIFQLKDESKLDFSSNKEDFYKGIINQDYDEKILQHRSAFIETIRFNNIYNRLILFDTESAHGVNSFVSDVPRLTQVFFVEKINTVASSPITRHKNIL